MSVDMVFADVLHHGSFVSCPLALDIKTSLLDPIILKLFFVLHDTLVM